MSGTGSQSGSSGAREDRPPTKLFRDLLKLRRSQGISPSEIARRMGMSRQQVYGMESGQSGDPSARTLERYAKAIGVRIVVVKRG